MYKIVLILLFGTLLSADLVGGVSVVVKQEPITLYDIKEEMRKSNVTQEIARDILIRKKLELSEIKERKINVTTAEVYEEIKEMATYNKMTIDQLYNAVRESSGLTSQEFKAQTKEKILSKKLYSAIAYTSVSKPKDEEIKEYYELHKDEFLRPISFDVIIYSSPNREELVKIISNPMFSSSSVKINELRLFYERIPAELSKLLENTDTNSFTPIVSDDKNMYSSFFLKSIEQPKGNSYENHKDKIINLIMGQKREHVLSEHFARLKDNTDIKIIRELK